ncbi:hypothetical protein ABW19_dt0209114 [Dactylella cylindrospora]|nr:hypothetical protein ABW19_dt0209114 [Dactylella cylindrospora]
MIGDRLESSGESDSDDSSSSRKRKRASTGSLRDPIDVDAPTPDGQQKSKKQKPGKGEYLCPICDQKIPQQLYESYMPDLLKKTALKRRLHKSHKLAKAHEDKKRLNIPDIDWDELDARCTKYFPYLQDIMNGRVKSYYRQVSEDYHKTKRRDGRSRTEAMFDKGNWEKEYPGYYGSRGRDIM